MSCTIHMHAIVCVKCGSHTLPKCLQPKHNAKLKLTTTSQLDTNHDHDNNNDKKHDQLKEIVSVTIAHIIFLINDFFYIGNRKLSVCYMSAPCVCMLRFRKCIKLTFYSQTVCGRIFSLSPARSLS